MTSRTIHCKGVASIESVIYFTCMEKNKRKNKSLSVLIINVCIILSEDNRQDKNCIEYSSVIQTKMKALAKEYNIDPCYTAPSHAKK